MRRVKEHLKRFATLEMCVCLCFFLLFSLVACNKTSSGDTDIWRKVYVSDYDYVEVNGVPTVVVSLSFDENGEALSSKIRWNSKVKKDGEFWKVQTVDVDISAKEICKEVIQMSSGHMAQDGVTYSNIAIVLKYVTKYKSVKSTGKRSVEDAKYVHAFELDKNSETQAEVITLRTQNSAAWYVLLIVIGVLLMLIAVGVSLGLHYKNCKKSVECPESAPSDVE